MVGTAESMSSELLCSIHVGAEAAKPCGTSLLDADPVRVRLLGGTAITYIIVQTLLYYLFVCVHGCLENKL